jgi:hypothetical protein
MSRLPEVVDGTPAQVAGRLVERLFVIGDIWFPTRNEMAAWDRSSAPLYLKWTRRGGFEIGPRLETVPAARIAPVLRGRLLDGGTGRTRIVAHVTFPRLTWGVLGAFTALGALWAAQIGVDLRAGTTHSGWAVACALYFGGILGGAGLAWWWGRRALLAEVPWLTGVLTRPQTEGDDW